MINFLLYYKGSLPRRHSQVCHAFIPMDVLLNGPVTSVHWWLALVLKEPIHRVMLMLTPLTFATCLCIVQAHLYCKIFAFEGQNVENKEFFREMFPTCILYCGGQPDCFIRTICKQSVCFFLPRRSHLSSSGFSSETPQLYFEKATCFCTGVLMFLPSI